MIDYHVHLWPHPEVADEAVLSRDGLRRFVDAAGDAGVREIAITEHFFRFRQFRSYLDEYFAEVADRDARDSMASYIAHHATADLDRYVEAIEDARAAGMPIRLGMEVDYYAGATQRVAELLSGYRFDVLLGSVHWIDAWRFDDLGDAYSMSLWSTRSVTEVWRSYTDAVVALAESRTCDVLAHVDLAKVAGFVPDAAVRAECEERIVDAVVASGVAVEVSSAGLRKPIGEAYPAPALLQRLVAAGASFTMASDGHEPALVGDRAAQLAGSLRALGVATLRRFVERRATDVVIDDLPSRDEVRS